MKHSTSDNTPEIVILWSQSYFNMPRHSNGNFWGIGDMIKGTIAISEHCINKGYHYKVDLQYHPISSLLIPASSNLRDLIITPSKEKNKAIFIPNNLDLGNEIDKLVANRNSNQILVMTNCTPPSEISDITKRLIKKILTLSSDHMDIFEKARSLVADYPISIHARTGSVDNVGNAKQFAHRLLLRVLPIPNGASLIFSDSEICRYTLMARKGFGGTASAVKHLGKNEETMNQSHLKGSMLELLSLSMSNKIFAFSIYPSPSGFSYWIAKCYNINYTFEQIQI